VAAEREAQYMPKVPPQSSAAGARGGSSSAAAAAAAAAAAGAAGGGGSEAEVEQRALLQEQKLQETRALENTLAFQEALIEERDQGIAGVLRVACVCVGVSCSAVQWLAATQHACNWQRQQRQARFLRVCTASPRVASCSLVPLTRTPPAPTHCAHAQKSSARLAR
jgi:hypothetical protein